MDRRSNRFLILAAALLLVASPRAHSACSTPTAQAGARDYLAPNLRMCDGTNWVNFSTDGTLTACAGLGGQMEYDTSITAYKYCNNTNWLKIKKASTCTVSSLTYQNKVTDVTNLDAVATLKISSDGTKLYASPQFTGRLSIWSTTAAPAAPSLLGAVANANLVDTTDSVIVGNYAFVAARNTDNVVVIDVSNPASPTYVTRAQTSPTSELANVWGITASDNGNYIYTVSWDAGAGLDKCFLNIFDISTPTAPVEVGSLNLSDAGAGATNRYCNKIVIKNNVALITFGEGFLAAVDVATPSAPAWITKVNATNGTNIDAIALSEDRNTLFAMSFSTSRLHSFNILNPSSPTWISSVLNSTYFNEAYGLVVAGKYAFSGGKISDAVAAVDISNPASMTVGANVTSATNLNGAGVMQRNGRYLFVGTIDGDGISVIDLGCDPETPYAGTCTVSKTVDFDSTNKTLNYCDGSKWRYMAGTPCAGALVGGFCWYMGAVGQSCTTVCASHGGYNSATQSYAGNTGTLAQCNAVLTAVGAPDTTATNDSGAGGYACTGCVYSTSSGGAAWRNIGSATTAACSNAPDQRMCACNN